jgi:hypothetical protein
MPLPPSRRCHYHEVLIPSVQLFWSQKRTPLRAQDAENIKICIE